MIYRYIYKITCTAGSFKDKFYFGQHTTTNLDDGYKGSGRKIKDYYKKYPNDFIKEIIAFYDSEEELNQAEYDIILQWLDNDKCLNIHRGGNKAYSNLSDEIKSKISASLKGKETWNKGLKNCYSEETLNKKRISMTGKKMPPRSEEWHIKQSLAHKGRYVSEETRQKLKHKIPWNKGLKLK